MCTLAATVWSIDSVHCIITVTSLGHFWGELHARQKPWQLHCFSCVEVPYKTPPIYDWHTTAIHTVKQQKPPPKTAWRQLQSSKGCATLESAASSSREISMRYCLSVHFLHSTSHITQDVRHSPWNPRLATSLREISRHQIRQLATTQKSHSADISEPSTLSDVQPPVP
jgi:hypothetical protein